jgi:hypothetical protein
MGRRLVIERLSEGSVPPSEEGTRKLDAPTISAIRLVFGVGKRPDGPPTDADFKPVYTVGIPVFSLGGLDSDGVHEFDGTALLGSLQKRAQRRQWAARLELEVIQAADSVNAADLYVETPFADDGPTFDILGPSRRGTTTAGGGRSLVFATSLAHDAGGISALGGKFSFQLRDADPKEGGDASVESQARGLALDFTQYEFEG